MAESSGCLRCAGELTTLEVEPFSVGGTTGGWKMLFGEWAELGKGMLDMEVLVCSTCRKVELRLPSYEPRRRTNPGRKSGAQSETSRRLMIPEPTAAMRRSG